MTWHKVKKTLAALAFVGIPLAISASCDPRRGTLGLYRYDNYGLFDVWVDDEYWYDDYYYDEVIFLP
jgi:hypothetical protein